MEMAKKFASFSPYKDQIENEYLYMFIDKLLKTDPREAIIIFSEGEGFIAANVYNFPFGPYRVATEIAWWVEPDKRQGKVGFELLEAFEYWASNLAGCSMVTMTSLDDKLGRFYEKKGYKLCERAYMKMF